MELYDVGRDGEKYVASKLSELGFTVLYVGGCQLYSLTGERFATVDLEPFGMGKTFWVQVKYKEPRKYYPDTGMEKWRYENIKKHQKESGIPALVLFTDSTKKIYGEWIDNIDKCESSLGSKYNSKNGNTMIYWLLDKLKDYKELL
jgi:hypothetical protein